MTATSCQGVIVRATYKLATGLVAVLSTCSTHQVHVVCFHGTARQRSNVTCCLGTYVSSHKITCALVFIGRMLVRKPAVYMVLVDMLCFIVSLVQGSPIMYFGANRIIPRNYLLLPHFKAMLVLFAYGVVHRSRSGFKIADTRQRRRTKSLEGRPTK